LELGECCLASSGLLDSELLLEDLNRLKGGSASLEGELDVFRSVGRHRC
jgi:hypothetical protein